MFKKPPITAYTSLSWNISGMRVTREYEILHKGEDTEVSEYELRCVTGGGRERQLLRRVLCTEQRMLELLNAFDIMKWDGFHGKHPRGVLDGEMFTFRATVNDGVSIRAEGSANFPKGFREFRSAVHLLLEEGTDTL
ncbi:MAG: hypothetical protein IJM25_09390 [Eubacterium sp.]|nr:hypothetical protein [Eubacterium sp.]